MNPSCRGQGLGQPIAPLAMLNINSRSLGNQAPAPVARGPGERGCPQTHMSREVGVMAGDQHGGTGEVQSCTGSEPETAPALRSDETTGLSELRTWWKAKLSVVWYNLRACGWGQA